MTGVHEFTATTYSMTRLPPFSATNFWLSLKGLCWTADAHGDDDDVEDTSRLRSHQRGKAPFVFVPWEGVQDSPLNLPVSKMDFYVPG